MFNDVVLVSIAHYNLTLPNLNVNYTNVVVLFGQVIPHLKAPGLLILIISVLDQIHDVASCYRTVCACKIFIACKKAYFEFTHQELSNEV